MTKEKELTLKGIPAAPGIVIGKVLLLDREQYVIPRRPIKEDQIQTEIKHFKDALIQTKQEIIDIKKRISEELGSEHGQIFSAWKHGTRPEPNYARRLADKKTIRPAGPRH